MGFSRVARAEDISPGQTRFFVVAGKPVVLANFEGRIYAYHGLCPHRGFPFEGAHLWGNLLTCPWHNFQYDVETGRNHYPRNVYPGDVPDIQTQVGPLKPYPVQVRGGEVWVDLEGSWQTREE